MFKHSLFLCATFALNAAAYMITVPNDQGNGWTASGPNAISWQRVNTDPGSFAIVLVNEDRSVLPVNNQLLASNIDGNSLSIAISPASGQTFPAGSGFRVNFIKSADDPNTIYAQSSQFTIGSGNGNASDTSFASGAITMAVSGTMNTGATIIPHVMSRTYALQVNLFPVSVPVREAQTS